MKTQIRVSSFPWAVLACTCVLLGQLAEPNDCQADQPVISSIRPDQTNILVEVNVPAGAQRVTLESRPRFGQGTWAPLAVAQNDGSAGTIQFRVSCSRQTELLRVRADTAQALPGSFYNGTNSFSAPSGQPLGALGPAGVGGVNAGGAVPSGASGDPARSVVESDIWQIDGGWLYFFNQYRGLQVIDITMPDDAKVTGRLALPASGEQMYLADSNHLVLLASGGCGYGTDQSRIVVVSVTNGVPTAITNLPIGGSVQDSRMVGTALYVASENYRLDSSSSNTVWEWGTVVTSFDLANPEHPAVRSTLWYPGYGNVVSASDTYLFVVTQDPTDWWQSLVQIIDITSPDGTMLPSSQLRTAGRVPDKFKLNYTNQVFTTISEDWRWTTGPITELETFHLPDPQMPGPDPIVKLGELELGSQEQLHATSFDGNLVYVVTFFQIDPLWIVDLSDPANPNVAGSVNVPGWSNYIYPLGNRLVTLGVESNRVAVSLFDVHDPSKPAVLSHLLLGQNYSWSDANYDEKAFTVLPEQGMVLVPYNGDTTNGWTMQVQLIDLTSSNLVARGIIHHQSQPRRTAFSHDRVLSLSGWELLSIDATDRDQPAVKGDLELAWSVDRLFVAGDYLLELSGSTGWWGYQASPTVRVASLQQPDQVLGETLLDGLPIVGAALKNGLLYVAQSQSYWYYYGPIVPLGSSGGPTGGPNTNPPNFFLTVLDAAHLPKLSVLGQTSIAVDPPGVGGTWNAVWPKENELVWASAGGFPWPFIGGGVAVPAGGGITAGPTGVAGGVVIWPWWGFGGGQLLAFDVSDSASPQFDSEVNLGTNGWWGFSQPFPTATRIYLSHNESELWTNTDYPDGLWIQRSLLDVIDYADPISPTVRTPVNIPGTLQGIAVKGELLYTLGLHWGTNQVFDWTQWLDASAYDGVSAHLVASLRLSDSWPHPVLVLDTNIFIGNPGYSVATTNVYPSQLEKWFLADSGNFTLNAKFQTVQPVSGLADRNGLLVAQEEDSSLDLFDDTSSGFAPVGHAQPSGCLWFDLSQADGGITLGLWAPLGAYGVEYIGLGQ